MSCYPDMLVTVRYNLVGVLYVVGGAGGRPGGGVGGAAGQPGGGAASAKLCYAHVCDHNM